MVMRTLDRSSPLPLWAQLEADLRRRLHSGEFDESFPTDHDLAAKYEVSRHTVREAIRHLNQSGLLTRQRGRGTVVNRAEFEQSLGTLYSLFQSVEEGGVAQTSVALEQRVTTDGEAARELGVDPSTELVLIARLRIAGDEPLAIDRAWLPAEATRGLLDVDWTHTSLYAELAAHGAPVPDQGWERLTPVLVEGDDQTLLGLDQPTAAFHLERLGLAGDRAVEWRETVIRGDRFGFFSDWRAGETVRLRPHSSAPPAGATPPG